MMVVVGSVVVEFGAAISTRSEVMSIAQTLGAWKYVGGAEVEPLSGEWVD